jgi:hypothetical protein
MVYLLKSYVIFTFMFGLVIKNRLHMACDS